MEKFVIAIREDPIIRNQSVEQHATVKKGDKFSLINEEVFFCPYNDYPQGRVYINDTLYTIALEPKHGWVVKEVKPEFIKHRCEAINTFGITQRMLDKHQGAYFNSEYSLIKSHILNWEQHYREPTLVEFLYEKVYHNWADRYLIVDEFILDTCYTLALYRPRFSKRFKGKITLYKNYLSMVENKETAMNVGRALSIMFPYLTASQIGEIVDEYRTKFAPRKFTLHTSTLASDFVTAYRNTQCGYEDPRQSDSRKNMSSSCMRGKTFDHQSRHPVEFYASGEFMIVWLTTKDGLIGGRCVVRLPYVRYDRRQGYLKADPFSYNVMPHVAAPVYGACDTSINMIEEYLDSIGADRSCGYNGWVGARLLNLPDGDGGYFGAYLDLEPREVDVYQKYLVVTNDGEIDASDYGGTLGNTFDYHCENCAEGLHDDEAHYSEDTNQTYCEHCFNDIHSCCDNCDHQSLTENIQSVHYRVARGTFVTDADGNRITKRVMVTDQYDYCESCCDSDAVYCNLTEEWWSDEEAIYIADEDLYHPIHRLEEDGFKQNEEGEYSRHGEEE